MFNFEGGFLYKIEYSIEIENWKFPVFFEIIRQKLFQSTVLS